MSLSTGRPRRKRSSSTSAPVMVSIIGHLLKRLRNTMTQRRRSPAKSTHFSHVAPVAAFVLTAGLFFRLWSALRAPLPPLSYSNAMTANGAAHSLQRPSGPRLAILIPYLAPADGAPTFPAYFDLFAMSAAGSQSHVDFLIFHCFIPPALMPSSDTLPANVLLVDLNTPQGCNMANLFLRVIDHKNYTDIAQQQQLASLLAQKIQSLPYLLVEYKPAFGHIFEQYLTNYTHWGYSDLDVVFGDLPRWIDPDEWTHYDIVTYGFGDQDKLYLRGQFTFHRNDPHVINQIWRHCQYLTDMDLRYLHNPNNNHQFKFESAEGCYSQAVIARNDIKVKFAVKAFSDVSEESPIYAHGVYLSLGALGDHGDRSVLYTASSIQAGKKLRNLSPTWFDDHVNDSTASSLLYGDKEWTIQQYLLEEKSPVQTYQTILDDYNTSNYYLRNLGGATKNELEAIAAALEEIKAHKVKCMYWAPKEYQLDLCTLKHSVHSDEVVILEDGKLLKQKFAVRENMFPEGIQSFPFFHFQEWKRTYRTTQLLTSHNLRMSPPSSSSAQPMVGLIITKEGTLPLTFPHPRQWAYSRSNNAMSSNWITFDTGATSSRPSNNRFCLQTSPKNYPSGATQCKIATAWPRIDPSTSTLPSTTTPTPWFEDSSLAVVTIVRSPAAVSPSKTTFRGRRVKLSSSWWDISQLDIHNDVTLALTLQLTLSQIKEEESVLQNLLGIADSNLFHWGARQPSILLIHIDSHSKKRKDKQENLLRNRVVQSIMDTFAASKTSHPTAYHLYNSLIAIVESSASAVSRKALMNMAANAAPTRWIVSGLELERGLLLSQEASLYALRTAKVYADLPGHVFVIPQFALMEEEDIDREGRDRPMFSSIGAVLLPTLRRNQTLSSDLSKYDCVQCAFEGRYRGDIEETDQEPGVGGGEQLLDDNEQEEEAQDSKRSEKRILRHLIDPIEQTVEEQMVELWWNLSVADLQRAPPGFSAGQTETSAEAIAEFHDRMEVSLISLLDQSTKEHLPYLRSFDNSPVLMLDRLGPWPEMLTLDLVPEVEEFGGRVCFNLLRMAQLATLGYRIQVLSGAFAASSPKTRKALCLKQQDGSTESSCSCNLSSKKALMEILQDEVKRLAKITVWTDFDSRKVEMNAV